MKIKEGKKMANELKVYNTEIDWSPKQERAIKEDGEVLVSASAGSGKTLTLIHRIIAEIGRGTSLKRILVLAYNNAAGEELRNRLSTELYNQLMECKNKEDEALFRQAIEDLPFGNIGTTHSFCSQTIRQNFEVLDISPSFEILSDDAAQILVNNALDTVFDKYLENQDEIFLEFGDIFSFSRGDDELRDIITRLYAIIDIRPDRESFYNTVKDCYDKDVYDSPFAEIIKKMYLESLQRIEREISECQKKIKLSGKVDEYQDLSDVYSDILIYINTCNHSKLKNIIDISNTKEMNLKTKANRNHDETRDRLKYVITEFKALVEKFAENVADSAYFEEGHKQGKIYINKILEIVGEFEKEFTKLKQQKNMLTYNDLEHKMIELIDIKGEELKNDFDAIFVDEYQDVNPTQEYIYSHLINSTAFFVGDVKQSIYEFRLADPNIFLARQRKYGEKSIQFNENHRSNDDILNFVNNIFNSIMTKESADIDYEKDKHYFVTKSKELGKNVQMHFFVEPKEVNPTEKLDVYSIISHQQKEKYESADEAEGRFIAKTIQSLLGQKKQDEKEGVYRYEDFAILFRKRSAATKILTVLRNLNIPLDIGSFNDSESKPETELIAMLSVIDNPRQDVPLVSFMQSILGGYDKNELLEIEQYRSNTNATNYYDALIALKEDKESPLAEKVEKTINTINNFRLRASFKTVGELLRDIISEFAYDAYLMQRGDSDISEIEAYITAIESIDENSSLAKFMSVYGKRKSSDDNGGTFGGNRVKISTYHGFKGLEVPVVFLPELHKKNSDTRTPTVTYYGNGYLAMDYYDSKNKRTYKTLSRYAVDLLNKQAEEKSEMRLLYVALTRAKEKMYLLSNISPNVDLSLFGTVPSFDWKSSMIDYIEEAVYNESLKLGQDLKHREETFVEKNSSEMLKFEAHKFDSNIEQIIKQAEKYVYPYEESTKLSSSYSVSELNTVFEEEVETPSIYQQSTQLGTLYHKVMEHISFDAQSMEDIQKEIDRMVEQGIIEKSNASLIKLEQLYKVMNSQTLKDASKGRCMREYKFTMYTPANTVIDNTTSTDKVLVQGVLDLLYESNGTINLIDYKLTRKTGEVLKNTYKKQLYLYKKAFESAFKKKIDHLGILSLTTGEYTPLD